MNIRRYYVPNAIVFITQVVDQRTPVFQDQACLELLQTTLRKVKEVHPFAMLSYVFLPDHFHLLIRPTGGSNFSQIMHSLKPNFTKAYKAMLGVTGPMKFWQKGFWDHVIRDEADLKRHLDYIHYNPVRHQLVTRPEDWPHSSFLHWKQRNTYPERWGWSLPDTLNGHGWHSVEEDHDDRCTPNIL
jgi:putative transposase